MEKGFLHLHVTIVSLFILLYLAKVYLLLVNKPEALDKLRSKTKIADMILGSLIIITGVYLMVKAPNIETYLIVKIVLVFASIPLGIIAMKKSNKALAIISVLLYVYIFLIAKTGSLTLKKEAFVMSTSNVPATTGEVSAVNEGEVIYKEKCALCHGIDGKQQTNGAKDLSTSKLTKDETMEQIKAGKGLMPSFKDVFNDQQLNALTEYVEGLRK
jgi:uncharacterized membrane protein SirB2